MKAYPLICPAILLTLHFNALAQTTESSLAALYGEPVEETFLVKPGVRVKAVYGADHRACVLTISGPISESELMKVFETAVPRSVRGIQTLVMDECMGVCRRVIQFENVEFTSGVIGNSQTSDPAAVIVFKRKDCEAAANEQKKVPMRSTSIGSEAANNGKAK